MAGFGAPPLFACHTSNTGSDFVTNSFAPQAKLVWASRRSSTLFSRRISLTRRVALLRTSPSGKQRRFRLFPMVCVPCPSLFSVHFRLQYNPFNTPVDFAGVASRASIIQCGEVLLRVTRSSWRYPPITSTFFAFSAPLNRVLNL